MSMVSVSREDFDLFGLGFVAPRARRNKESSVHQFHHPLARARTEPAGRAMAPPAPHRQVFLFLFRRFADGVEAIDRSIDLDRPLSS